MYRYAVYVIRIREFGYTCSAREFELISRPTAAVNASQVPLIETYILAPAAGVTSFVQHRFPATNTRHPTSGADSGVGLPTHPVRSGSGTKAKTQLLCISYDKESMLNTQNFKARSKTRAHIEIRNGIPGIWQANKTAQADAFYLASGMPNCPVLASAAYLPSEPTINTSQQTQHYIWRGGEGASSMGMRGGATSTHSTLTLLPRHTSLL